MATATPSEIKNWEKEHGRIHEIVVDLNISIEDKFLDSVNPSSGKGNKEDSKQSNLVSSWFRHPTLIDVQAAETGNEKDKIAHGRILYENLKLKVDPKVEESDEAKCAIYFQLIQLFKVKHAFIKEA